MWQKKKESKFDLCSPAKTLPHFPPHPKNKTNQCFLVRRGWPWSASPMVSLTSCHCSDAFLKHPRCIDLLHLPKPGSTDEGGLNNRNLPSHGSGGQKSMIKVPPAGFWGGLSPGLADSRLLPASSTWTFLCVWTPGASSSSYEDPGLLG